MHPILDHRVISERYFFPQRAPLPDATLVPTSEGHLACWRSAPPSEKPVLVHFHGNGELVHHWVEGFVPVIQSMGYEVFLAEYRGYGASTGHPRLAAMLDDVQQIVEAVGVPTHQMVAFGRSVGSIYAIEMAHRFPRIAGLVLESGIADVLQRLELRMHPQELGCTQSELKVAVEEHLDHEAKLKAYASPLLILHAEGDHLVTIDHAERNHAWAASTSKRLVRFPFGDHNSILAMNTEAYFGELARFLDGVRPMTLSAVDQLKRKIEELELLRLRRVQGLDDGAFVRGVVEDMDETIDQLKVQLSALESGKPNDE